MAAQDLRADRMEGAEPRHALGHVADQRGDAVLHLARRLVGEGHREDFGGPGPAGREDMGDAGRQHARLAGAGAGKHEQRTVERLHRLALFGVQAGEIVLRAAPRRRQSSRGNAARFRGREVVVEKRNGVRLGQKLSSKQAGRRCHVRFAYVNKMALGGTDCEGWVLPHPEPAAQPPCRRIVAGSEHVAVLRHGSLPRVRLRMRL